jgi:hypothetical protein
MASTITVDMILNDEDPFEEVDIPDIAQERLASFAHSSLLKRNNLNQPKRNASRTPQNTDQTISS